MSLLPFFDDFPLALFSNGHPHRRRSRPILRRFVDSMEDDMDQKIGYLYRKLPGVLQEMMEDFDKQERTSKKRKHDSDSVALYEPKSKVQVSKKDDKFQICLDTSHYQPDEITVKVINDKVTISAKHESKNDDVYEFHEMHRSFSLPNGVDPNTIVSKLNPDGQLTVEAPMKAIKEATNERNVPIVKSNEQPAVENNQSPSK